MSSGAAAIATPLMEILPASAWHQVAPVWRELVESSCGSSFFLKVPWVETWIEVFSAKLDVSIAVFTTLQEPVGICLLVHSKKRRAMLPCRRISLNASGESSGDATYLECNNLVCRQGWEPAIAAQLAEYVMTQREEEIALDGFAPGPAYDAFRLALSHLQVEEVWYPAYYVNLRELRQSATNYETALGHATRKHLRQSVRRYAELGRLQFETATDTSTALAMFDELADLNRRRWQDRSPYPVFCSPRFLAFHKALITKCFHTNGVELSRLSSGRRTVGVIYNLLDEGRVYFYQCGLDYSIDPKLSPGTVALFHSIQHSLESGADTFDFLSGAAPYKQRLATGSRPLVWAVFRKPGLKTDLFGLVHSARRRLASHATRRADEMS